MFMTCSTSYCLVTLKDLWNVVYIYIYIYIYIYMYGTSHRKKSNEFIAASCLLPPIHRRTVVNVGYYNKYRAGIAQSV